MKHKVALKFFTCLLHCLESLWVAICSHLVNHYHDLFTILVRFSVIATVDIMRPWWSFWVKMIALHILLTFCFRFKSAQLVFTRHAQSCERHQYMFSRILILNKYLQSHSYIGKLLVWAPFWSFGSVTATIHHPG